LLLWIGAGNSFSSGVPLDRDDAEGLAFRLASIHYNNDGAQIATALGATFRLADLAAVIGRARIRELIVQQGWIDLPISAAHRAIAAMVAEGFNVEIVTVNYDPLLEKALDEEGLSPTVIYSAATYRQLTEQSAFVIKIHGCPFRDNDPNHLVMMKEELSEPPPWVITFLKGRLPERVFIYVGFSGNADYVRNCIRTISAQLDGNINEAFGIDVRATAEVFGAGNSLGQFYQESGVQETKYNQNGSDSVFREVADRVFRQIALDKLDAVKGNANAHGCANTGWLAAILNSMNYEQLRTFAKRVHLLPQSRVLKVSQVAIDRVFLWMLMLAHRNILDANSFRPILACPYYPGGNGTAVAPVMFFDGARQEVSFSCDHLKKNAVQESFKTTYQIGAEPRWFAVIVNCIGNVSHAGNEIIARDPDSAAKGYDPIIFVDENTLVSQVASLERIFR
jgi:SIR2-like domain